MNSLRTSTVRESTLKNYRTVWHSFNKFLIRLDKRPRLWEDRTALFCTYLIDKGSQSQTVKSYISAIKIVLASTGYNWQEGGVLLSSLTKSCKLRNDQVHCHLPIGKALLEMILFEITHLFDSQVYLTILYQVILCLGYYGLM